MTGGESDTTVEVANSTTNSSLSLQCGIMDQQYLEVWNTYQWWCEGILFTGVGLVGLVANFVSIGILATKNFRKHSFNQLLIALAIFDILFILVSIPVYSFSLFPLFVGNQLLSSMPVDFLYPLPPVFLCASIYMTLAITIERYLAVCKPTTYRSLNVTMSNTKRALMYVTPVVFLSFCLNIKTFIETQAIGTEDDSNEIEASDTRQNSMYLLYYTIYQIFHPTLTIGIFPMAALIYLNTSIFFGIRRANAMRNQNPDQPGVSNINTGNNNNTSTSAATAASNEARQSENNLSIALIGIGIMHLACHSLRVLLAILSVHLIGDTILCTKDFGSFTPPLWTMCAESVSSLMIMINFSGNFLIYFSVLTAFKAVH